MRAEYKKRIVDEILSLARNISTLTTADTILEDLRMTCLRP